MITAKIVRAKRMMLAKACGNLGLLAQLCVFGFMASTAAVAQEGSNKLQDIEVQSLPGDKVELRLVLSGPAPEPLAFTIDQPARIALDLADTSLGLDSRRTDVGVGVLDTVLAAEANGRTRVVLNLDDLVAYQTRVAGNAIYVTLESATSLASNRTEFPAAPAAASHGHRPRVPGTGACRAGGVGLRWPSREAHRH